LVPQHLSLEVTGGDSEFLPEELHLGLVDHIFRHIEQHLVGLIGASLDMEGLVV
jgi:hypothetical protein